MTGRNADVSVILPAYRLGSQIYDNVLRAQRALEPLGTFEIVVVDDGSPDETATEAQRAASGRDDIVVLSYQPNRGKGAALQAGVGASSGDIVVFLDADLDLPPEQVPAVVAALTPDVDVIVGAKRASMSRERYPLLRRILSVVFSTTIKILFRLPIAETQTGLKVFRRPVLDAVFEDVETARYAFDLELLVRAHRAGYRVVEVPVQLAIGAAGVPVTAKTLWEMGRDTIRLWVNVVRGRI